MAMLRRIANLFRSHKLRREIEAELRSHTEMRIEDNIAAGMSPEKARRDARLRFGNVAVTSERVTAADTVLHVESFARGRDTPQATLGCASSLRAELCRQTRRCLRAQSR